MANTYAAETVYYFTYYGMSYYFSAGRFSDVKNVFPKQKTDIAPYYA